MHGLAVGRRRRYPLPLRPCKGGAHRTVLENQKVTFLCWNIYSIHRRLECTTSYGGSMRASKETWKLDEPSYSRTWTEIEEMLHSAVNEMNAQRAKFHLRKVTGPREAKYRALMKYQRAKGIVDTLRWTIGVRGQKSPLKEGLGD